MKKKKLIISSVCVSLVVLVSGASSLYINYKNIEDAEKDEFREGLAIYIENDNGTYSSYYGSSFNLDGYSIDISSSTCVDGNNQTINPGDILSTATSNGETVLVVSTDTKTYCEIYLKKDSQ